MSIVDRILGAAPEPVAVIGGVPVGAALLDRMITRIDRFAWGRNAQHMFPERMGGLSSLSADDLHEAWTIRRIRRAVRKLMARGDYGCLRIQVDDAETRRRIGALYTDEEEGLLISAASRFLS